ncbi:MAG: cyclic nucleotide-binding domain-containing protein [Kofleriaceae bacterium]
MAKDGQQLRDEAATAAAAGKYKRALECYLELERQEPGDAQWPKRVAETYRRLGKPRDAVAAFERAADRYAQNGFLVQAIAVCKLILQIDPSHVQTQHRLAAINAAQGAGPTRIGSLSDNHPSLHENPAVALLRSRGGSSPPEDVTAPARAKPPSAPPVVSFIEPARTKSAPIVLPHGAGLESVPLGEVMAGAHQQRDDGSQPGIVIIPIDLDDSAAVDVIIDDESGSGHGAPELDDAIASLEVESGPGARQVGAAARQALAATPLFAGLSEPQLEALIERIDLMTLAPGQVLFHEREHGDSLYVISEGEVVVEAKGPPRVPPSVLRAGAFFGEVTLITDHPRMATVTAQTMVEALRIDRDALAFVVARHPEVVSALLRFVRDRLVERWMRTSPLCRPFGNLERREFVARFRFLEIEAGSVVMAPGDPSDGLYIVLAGRFSVRRGGVEAVTLGPGELIGETVLMTGEPLQSTVIAATKCLSLWLPVEDFHEVIMIHPHVLEYVGAQAERRRLQIY